MEMSIICVTTLIVSVFMMAMKLYFRLRQYEGKESMEGKTVIITGATAGIGRETAYDLARRGARLILACRNVPLAEELAEEIKIETNNRDIEVRKLDLASLTSIREFCDYVNKNVRNIDVLINNAGMLYSSGNDRTEDGFDIIFGVNHLGHFLLTNLLLEKLKASAPSRLVVVSSTAHKWGKIDLNKLNNFNKMQVKRYANSKLANALFTREFAKRMQGTGVTAYCVHPGVIRTEIGRSLPVPRFMRMFSDIFETVVMETPFKGAQTTIYCAVADDLANESGHYYCDCQKDEYLPIVYDDGVARKLWEASEKLLGL